MSTAQERLASLQSAFKPQGGDQQERTYTKFYQFYKMNAGEQAVVRFLPDANPNNPRSFLIENLTHSLIVNGKKRIVACNEMYDGFGSCPICQKSREFYNKAREAGETKDAPGPLTALGKKYYRKKEFIGQVYIANSPISYDKNEGHEHEMPVAIGTQICNVIQAAFGSGDLEEAPYCLQGGYDFRIMKTEQGNGQANYTMSRFVTKQSDVPEDVLAGLNLYDLSTLRNRQIDVATLEAMLNADLTGGSFNGSGNTDEAETNNYSNPSVAQALTQQFKTEDDVAPSAIAPASASNAKIADMIAQIQARNAAPKN